MAILRTYMLPHPPMVVPSVGQGREAGVQKTIDSFLRAAKNIGEDKPDTIIFITPHGQVYGDYINIASGKYAEGSFARFGAPESKYGLDYDEDAISCISKTAEKLGIAAGTLGSKKGHELDHGVLVPLHFISDEYSCFKSIVVSISGLDLETHYRFGMCLNDALDEMGRKAVIVASGDLSHKLTHDGPYGFAKEGPEFDRMLVEAMEKGDFLKLLTFDPHFTESAAECGLRSFVVMAGALDGRDVDAKIYSYEGTFGVGYAIGSFKPGSINENRHFLNDLEQINDKKVSQIRGKEDIYVSLARTTVETYVKTNKIITPPEGLPKEMLANKAGTFVSIKKYGNLRGCIGTTEPYRASIAEEIIGNAISASTKDPRFPPINENELNHLEYSVDILAEPEPINGPNELDVLRYGVIVTSENGSKRGLLLPNLDGVDTVEAQIDIARQKAGIKAGDKYSLMRFEVVRHK